MADLRGFDANTVEPNDSFDPLPNGDYLCIITASEMKPTKAGNGAFLELELQVLDGPHQGRKLWDRLNVRRPFQAVSLRESPRTAWKGRPTQQRQ